jgi:multidrug transporter EmrE-like cation transporter
MTVFLFPPCQIVPAMLPVIAIGTGVFFVSFAFRSLPVGVGFAIGAMMDGVC